MALDLNFNQILQKVRLYRDSTSNIKGVAGFYSDINRHYLCTPLITHTPIPLSVLHLIAYIAILKILVTFCEDQQSLVPLPSSMVQQNIVYLSRNEIEWLTQSGAGLFPATSHFIKCRLCQPNVFSGIFTLFGASADSAVYLYSLLQRCSSLLQP